jgi:diguanylate cyclase (GGDEF)-like protein/PAS domain S-box-containing protein
MLNIPLSLRLTIGLMVVMIGCLLLGEALGFRLDNHAGMITFIIVLGAAISLLIISRSHNQIDLAAVAPTLLTSTLDALTEGVVLIDGKERIVIANAAFADIVGKTPQQLKGKLLSRFAWQHVNDYEQEAPWVTSIREASQLTERQMMLANSNGDKKLYVVDCAPAKDSNGIQSGVMVTFDDVTSREEKNLQLEGMLGMLKKSRDEIRRQNLELQELATRDSLTNCLNRRSFYDKYETVFNTAQRDGHMLSCIMADIDLFKTINDRFGHAAGDDVICKVADTLHHSVRATDTVCRYGGEEFCIILPGIGLEQAIEMSERARKNIARLTISDESHDRRREITSSFGIAAMEHHPADFAELIDRADQALYQSKHTGRNRVTAWHPEECEDWHTTENTDTHTPETSNQADAGTTIVTDPASSSDVLTGLPDRKAFYSSIVTAVQQCKTNRQHASIMMLDLDMFKRINSTLGYTVGDELLKIVGERIVDVLRSTDSVARLTDGNAITTIYRLGGDEFGILLTGLECTEFTGQIISRIITSITSQIELHGHEIHLACSAGISLYPDDGTSADALLKNASTALYHSKLQNHSHYQFYHQDLNKDSLESLKLENDLRHAIERNELDLYYQPKIDLESGLVNSVEALLRWRHPAMGMIPPDEFIPIAEKTGLITTVGYWVLETACRQIRKWQDAGHEHLTVAVNLSALQFRQGDLLERIHDTLKCTNIRAQQLELEITESTIMDDIDAASSTMRELHCSGVRISIDDFGTGYSSLSHLKRFPINTVKIDRSFIRDITTDSDDAAIVSAIIAMAHNMGLRVIAEGVETREQLEHLKTLDCDEVQGFLFSPPIPHEDAGEFVGKSVDVLLQSVVTENAAS